MKNNIKEGVVLAFVVGALVIPGFAFAQVPPTDGGNLGGVVTDAVPATAGGNTGAAVSTTPPPTAGGNIGGVVTNTPPPTAGGNTGAAVSTTPPPTAGGNTGAAVTNTPPPTAGGNTGAAVTSTPAPAPTTSTGGPTGSNMSVSTGGGSSVGGGSVTILPMTSCLLTAPLTAGASGAEVTKLQNFLKNTEGINVAVTGNFDAQTVAAVKAFQLKYASEILAPWGVTVPTGNVYLTTLKKINSRACNVALNLTPAELAEINAHRARVESGATVSTEVVGSTSGSETPTPSASSTVTPSPTSTPDDTLVGAAGKTSIATKIWNFIKRIFGRN